MRAAYHYNSKCAIATTQPSQHVQPAQMFPLHANVKRKEEGEDEDNLREKQDKGQRKFVEGKQSYLSCVHDNVSLISLT